MPRLSTYHRKAKIFNHNVKRQEIIEFVVKKRNVPILRKKTINNIIGMYCDLMMESVLDGNRVKFADGTTIFVNKQVLEKPKPWKNAHLFPDKVTQEFCFNPKRINENYLISFENKELEDMGFKFFASNKWRKKLFNILMKTDKQYASYEHKKKG
jgi:hypothetical protein